MVVNRGDDTRVIRGPNSDQAKFANMFCANCNNARSQPFDRAYDRFIKWYLDHESAVEIGGALRLDEMHTDWRAGTDDVLRYFVKHIGSRIAEHGYAVPSPLIDFLDGGGDPLGLACGFEINALHAEINTILRENPTPEGTSGNLFQGPVTGTISRSTGEATLLQSWWAYHGLMLVWDWSSERPIFWTNLSQPRVQLPIEDQKGGRALRRVREPGVEGRVLALNWHSAQTEDSAAGAALAA